MVIQLTDVILRRLAALGPWNLNRMKIRRVGQSRSKLGLNRNQTRAKPSLIDIDFQISVRFGLTNSNAFCISQSTCLTRPPHISQSQTLPSALTTLLHVWAMPLQSWWSCSKLIGSWQSGRSSWILGNWETTFQLLLARLEAGNTGRVPPLGGETRLSLTQSLPYKLTANVFISAPDQEGGPQKVNSFTFI